MLKFYINTFRSKKTIIESPVRNIFLLWLWSCLADITLFFIEKIVYVISFYLMQFLKQNPLLEKSLSTKIDMMTIYYWQITTADP
jgi:hypothetical protein